jgi:primosomal protein N' (replication factor Y)
VQIIKVLIPKVGLFPLDYLSELKHAVGDLITVSFRNKIVTGIVWQIECNPTDRKLKQVIQDQPFNGTLSKTMIELI